MIEYYILIVVGAIGTAVCSFLLGRKTVKPKHQSHIKKQSQEDSLPLPPPPPQQEKPKGKTPPSMKQWENVLESKEEEEEEL